MRRVRSAAVMSQKMMDRRLTMGWRSRTGWGAVLLAGAGGASACFSDVQVPPCVRTDTCNVPAGEAGMAESDSAGVAGSGGNAHPSGGDSTAPPGEAGVPNGGSDGTHGDGPDAGAGGTDTLACETCSIQPPYLVAPCAGKAYDAILNVTGGTPPYAWRLSPAGSGWSIAPDPREATRALLHADAVAAGRTTISVTAIDSRAREKSIEYQTTARDACWFAYTASRNDNTELALVDPLVEPAAPVELENNVGVYDFQFSPDGRYLAYRYGADATFPSGRHLALVELSTLDEITLTFFEDAVTAYAWSPDASTLAVGYSAGGEQFLSGARMPAPGSLDSPLLLAKVAAHIESNLTWIGNGAVAYEAELQPDYDNPGEFLPNPYHYHTPFYARLGASGFGASQYPFDTFAPNVFLRPAPDGFWMIDATLTTFFPTTDDPLNSVPHYGASLIAPSGRFSAVVGNGSLEILARAEGIGTALASSKANETCPMPLAWSQQDRIACVADVENGPGAGTHGEVRFFDLPSQGTSLEMSTLDGFCQDDLSIVSDATCTAQRSGYGYGMAEAMGAPRAFSPSGQYFAFSRASGPNTLLYWADLTHQQLSVSLRLWQTNAPLRMAFSPDSQRLALQAGTKLFVEPMAGSGSSIPASTPDHELETLTSCTEELPTAPDRYCGNTSLDAPFRWAPDSKALAYRTNRAIAVIDASQVYTNTFIMPVPTCEAPACSGDFEFQPTTYQSF
jgi:hypothetical protein